MGNSTKVCIVDSSLSFVSSLSSSYFSSSFPVAGGVHALCIDIPISTLATALGSLSSCVIDFGGDRGGRSKSVVVCIVLGGSYGGTLTSFIFSTNF